MVSPCTNIENKTTKYVIGTNILLVSLDCSDNANATEMPPRKPPQVNIVMAFLSKLLLCFNTTMGSATDNNRAASTIIMVAPHNQSSLLVKGITSISKPISKNKMAFITSSI